MLETHIAALGAKMQEPTFYQQDSAAIVALNNELAALQVELDAAYVRWQRWMWDRRTRRSLDGCVQGAKSAYVDEMASSGEIIVFGRQSTQSRLLRLA